MKCCTYSCGIAATLIAGMAYCTYMGNRSQLVTDYMRTLTADQQQTYAKIVEERRGIYLRGFGWGLLLSALLLGIHHQYLTMSRAGLLCTVAAITQQQQDNGFDCGVACLLYAEKCLQGYEKEDIMATTHQHEITEYRRILSCYLASLARQKRRSLRLSPMVRSPPGARNHWLH